MSIGVLASQLYTIKSRKNIPLSAAITSMVKEDIAARFSVYNLVRMATGSQFLATIAQAKYGKKTPIEKEEDKVARKKYAQEKRFKQFTANSIANLNNRINTLTAITERNSALILNLYNDVGSFKNQRKVMVNNFNSLTAVRMPIKSRTVKYQIDQLRAEVEAMKMLNAGALAGKSPLKMRKRGAFGAAVGGAAGAAAGGEGETPSGSLLDKAKDYAIKGLIGGVAAAAGAKTVSKILRKPPTPTKPTAKAVPKTSAADAKKAAQKYLKSARTSGQARIPKGMPGAGRFVKPTPSVLSRISGAAKTIAPKALGVVGRVFSTEAQIGYTVGRGTLEMATGAAGQGIASTRDAIAAKYGLKLIKNEKGMTYAYEIYGIPGKQFKYNELPVLYKDIVDAYLGPDNDRSKTARDARERIALNPGAYERLGKQIEVAAPQMATPGAISIEPPPELSSADLRAMDLAAAIKVAEPTMQEPGAVNISAPKLNLKEKKTTVETVKEIIIHAAKRVGVEPGIMLAMGQQESSFNPNAQPYDKKTGKLLSSAKGLFQFINSTWKSMVEKYSDQYKELLNGPLDPMANALAGALYVKENSNVLKKNGIPINGTTIYASHFLGSGGAAKLLTSNKSASAVDVLPQAAASNPHIFYDNGKPRTVKEVIDVLYNKVGKKAEQYTAQLKAAPPPLEYATGAPVAQPPTMVAQTTMPKSDQTEMKAEAGLMANRKTQTYVAALASKVTDLEKRMGIDQPFPSVIDTSFG